MTIKPFNEVDDKQRELQSTGNGRPGQFKEIGTSGLETWVGYLRQAYHAELRWPEVYPLFDRIRRSDPEISIVRSVFGALGRSVSFEWELPDEANDVDKRAQEFGYSLFDDMEGGYERWRDALLASVPFMGWGWWEMVACLRKESWRPPDGDPWRSKFNDGLIGVRRLAWRDQSSFYSWEMDDDSGRLMGMNQMDLPHEPVTIPIERSIHITIGDTESPEGLSPLESVWRLERIKYGLELVQGIGYEHSAGYLDVKSDKAQLTPADHTAIRKAARAIMSIQEGNFAAWPKGLEGELKDVNFSAAGTILESIRYYGILKLQVYAMSWIAMASTAKTGAYAAVQDVSGMFIQIYNAMLEGFVQQLDRQFAQRVFDWNAASFVGMTKRPKLVAVPIEKGIALAELGSFMQAFAGLFPLDDADVLAFRRYSGFLSETLPEEDEMIEPEEEEEEEEEVEPTTGEEGEAEETIEEETEEGELAFRPFIVPKDENSLDVSYLAPVTEKDVNTAMRKFKKWAEKNEPKLAEWMDAEVKEEKEEKP